MIRYFRYDKFNRCKDIKQSNKANVQTMSWLRSSPLRQSFTRTSRSRSIDATSTECDPKACYDSFCKHWQQIYDIILRAEVSDIGYLLYFKRSNTVKRSKSHQFFIFFESNPKLILLNYIETH